MMVIAQQMQDLIDNCLVFHADYLQEREPGTCFNCDFRPLASIRRRSKHRLFLYDRHDHAENTLDWEAGEVLR